MLAQRKYIVPLALALFTASASADDLVYVTTFIGQFGAIDIRTGAFHQIGPTTPDPLGGLVVGPAGYLGVSFAGNLDKVNPATGAISVIGATGLGNSAQCTAKLDGRVYATDSKNNLYSVDTATGVASLIGPTGIPPLPPPPVYLGDASLFAAGGKLYATFDAFNATTTPCPLVVNPELYEIDPRTGVARRVGPTAFQINAAVELGGTVYAFTAGGGELPSGQTCRVGGHDEVLRLDPATGNTAFVSNYDVATFFVTGAAQVLR
jgi:hypothetical protein